jgi:hypothetical protein
MTVAYLVFNVGRSGHLASKDVQLSTGTFDLFSLLRMTAAMGVPRLELVGRRAPKASSGPGMSANGCIAISTPSLEIIKSIPAVQEDKYLMSESNMRV